ncbi:very low-density lipoprotein receptor-like isoform X2 [Littorina saxatilis]|uniref:very low-density lipoprotein receptor-like isoform X2 n=1 Tax=Littorina saxatilis TaxID=31220 RepID=UPI0038B50A17
MCRKQICSSGKVKCANNVQCIHAAFVCDGDTECADNSDEDPEMCRNHTCAFGRWKCANNVQCIYAPYRCDGAPDCADNSDEDPEMCSQEHK